MVARTWSGMAKRDRIDAYLTHLREKTLPSLGGIAGHRGAFVLQRPSSDGVAVTVITLWDSVESISHFAGSDPERAVVPAEDRAMLMAWDERAVHWDIAQVTEL
jgi:heme-degrading monooxygenase HmoA